jgi:hypothetical protein
MLAAKFRLRSSQLSARRGVASGGAEGLEGAGAEGRANMESGTSLPWPWRSISGQYNRLRA